MKKLLFLAMCLFTVGTVSAQGYYYGPRHRRPPRRVVERSQPQRRYDDFYTPKVGLAVGLNVSNTVDAYNSNYSSSSLAGWHAGLTFDVPIIYPLSFAPEVLFSQKGYEVNDRDGKFTQRTNYIDVPLLAKFRVVRGFNLLVGPQLTFLTSTKNTYESGLGTSVDHIDNDASHSYVAGVVGVSFDINRNVEIRGRYNIDLGENRPYADQNLPDYRNQVWQIGLGFKFQ
ncbi:PorT family protein [Mucilaginibacter rubeus]|uniref:PorT family protein n=1 Tax=Mucilaginibacter rubeus TaxID=2027860 RepID=A0AAE6JI87_9SPHI|nr:porin family protein [Mucilaginibacter rubeus]QEM05941.1 PorT family protein [Mucilaginibacter rubeus]QTE44938.1 PorT family protein [Mucilaginibacter rubeus]QTE51535.1 PorT family protein [Mucilaginibacter rubeus]QTE56622.1 PorT family protein [Mucilaginibacter rubeus]QTE63915.1 PorT family protein [Mucilaginibacter rubeus]